MTGCGRSATARTRDSLPGSGQLNVLSAAARGGHVCIHPSFAVRKVWSPEQCEKEREMGAGWGTLHINKQEFSAPGLGAGLAPVEALEQRSRGRGCRRALSNRNVGVLVATEPSTTPYSKASTVGELRSRRPRRAAQGLPLQACEVAAPGRATRPRPSQAHPDFGPND